MFGFLMLMRWKKRRLTGMLANFFLAVASGLVMLAFLMLGDRLSRKDDDDVR